MNVKGLCIKNNGLRPARNIVIGITDATSDSPSWQHKNNADQLLAYYNGISKNVIFNLASV